MIKSVLIFANLFMSFLFFSQDKNSFDLFYHDIEKADSLIQIKEYKNAIILLRKAEKFTESNPFMYSNGYQNLQIASLLFKLGKTKDATEELKKAIINGETDVFNYKYLFNDSIESLIKPQINKIYKDLVKLRFNKLKNIEAYIETQKLLELDQIIRVNNSEFISKDVLNPNNKLGLMEAMDEIITDKVITLVKKHGWNLDLETIMWHHRDYRDNDPFWIQLKPYFENEIKKGNLPNSFFSRIEDFVSLEKTGYTIYGTIPGKINLKTVNEMRKKVHLPPFSKEVMNLLRVCKN